MQVDTVNIYRTLKTRNVSEEGNFKINQKECYLYNGCKNCGKNLLSRRTVSIGSDALGGGKIYSSGQVRGLWI